ncbi:MAG: hypothetical protein JNM93_00675 [Bacteriovoracaceae bacterium]|nr:hypothetical protein [Bacteriovoracaceae bacterium]
MAFGLKKFQNLKEKTETKITNKFYQNIIVGEDISAIATLLKLKDSCAPEKLLFIASDRFNKSLLELKLKAQLNQLRGSALAAYFAQPTLETMIYKNAEFKLYTEKQSLPAPFLGRESFFAKPLLSLSLEKLLSLLQIKANDWANLDEIIAAYRQDKAVVEVKKTQENDLVNVNKWEIRCSDTQILSCENLFWAASAKKFLNYLTNKDQFHTNTLQFFQSIVETAGYSMTFSSNEKLFTENTSVLIPQSITHEHGYFLGEFFSENNGQEFTFQAQIHEEDFNTEELSKKILLLKRTLQRIFEKMPANIKESIIFEENMFVDSVNDDLYFDYATHDLDGFFFLGQCSPIAKNIREKISADELKYFPRTLISLCQFNDSLSAPSSN